MKIVLAGEYPKGTFEKILVFFKDRLDVEFREVNKIEDYNKMTDAEIIILRIFKANKEIINNNKNLKMIMRWGAGFDSVDIEEAGKNGVIVTNTPGVNAGAVAELTILLILALNRNLINHSDSLRNGIWSKNDFLNTSWTLDNKVVGLIGSGNIGKNVAKLLNIFGAKVKYYDPRKMDELEEKKYNMTYVDFETLIKESDVISLHIPLLESTKNIIGKKEIQKMKDGILIINTSRGGLIDEEALLNGIKTGKVRGAGLDGVVNEPLSKEDELLNTHNIIVTPHVGGGTIDLSDKIISILVEDIFDFLANKEVKNIVNKKYLK